MSQFGVSLVNADGSLHCAGGDDQLLTQCRARRSLGSREGYRIAR